MREREEETAAETTWVHDTGDELERVKRPMRASVVASSRDRGRGRDERDKHENARAGESGDKRLRFRK